MKSLIQLIVVFLFLSSCSNDSTSSDEKQLANNSSTEKKSEQATTSTTSGDGIVGTWKMYLDAFDKNENQILDDEERKNAVPNKYRMQLNADGTCRLQDVFTGT